MKKNYNTSSFIKKVLIKGNVCYKDRSPVENAIVFLEAFVPDKDYEVPSKYYKGCCDYTNTDCNGEFCFVVYDTRYYYKIKVWDNGCTSEDNENFTIHLD